MSQLGIDVNTKDAEELVTEVVQTVEDIDEEQQISEEVWHSPVGHAYTI
jgi:hypothetical protein